MLLIPMVTMGRRRCQDVTWMSHRTLSLSPVSAPPTARLEALGGFDPPPHPPGQEFGASSLETQLGKSLGGQHLWGGGQGAANPWEG